MDKTLSAVVQQFPPQKLWVLFCFLMIQLVAKAQQPKAIKIDTEAFGDNSRHWYGIAEPSNIINPKLNQLKYKSTDIKQVADNILLYQKNNGGWPKNYDVMAVLTPTQKDSLAQAKNELNTTFDNGTTYTHITCLAEVFTVTKAEKYKIAALKGLDFIISAQYANGGWPQYYPLENNYSRHITYNDGVFEGIMQVLKSVVDHDPTYTFVNQQRRQKLQSAYQKGLNCIIKTQIIDNGIPTAWCQQHDEITLQPAWARAFEPPSICNGESADLVLFLMSIDHPKPEIIQVIKTAVAWFKTSAIQNTRVKTVQAPTMQTKFRVSKTDKVVETDPIAPQIWTRYYELKTHKPLFCNRDSKVVYSLAEVDRERRDGYGWYTYSPQKVLNAYPAWEKNLDLKQ